MSPFGAQYRFNEGIKPVLMSVWSLALNITEEFVARFVPAVVFKRICDRGLSTKACVMFCRANRGVEKE